MSKPRVLAFAFAVLAWTSAGLLYLTFVHDAGFPDGFLTELARAQRLLFGSLAAASTVLGLAFVALGLRNGPVRLVLALVALHVLAGAGSVAIDAYLRSHLADGAGG